MPKRFALWIGIALLLLPVTLFAGDLVFTVKPHLDLQSAQIGVDKGKFTPYVGMDYLAIGAKAEYVDKDYFSDSQTGNLYLGHVGRDELEGSATLLIPHIGARYDWSTASPKPYVFAGFFKSFAFVSVDGKEKDTSYNPDGSVSDEYVDTYELEQEAEDVIKSLLGFWGFNLGFGAEYMVSESFGVSGEYMLRFIYFSTDTGEKDSEDWDNDGVADWREEWKGEVSATLRNSQATLALNFYFQ